MAANFPADYIARVPAAWRRIPFHQAIAFLREAASPPANRGAASERAAAARFLDDLSASLDGGTSSHPAPPAANDRIGAERRQGRPSSATS